METIFFWYLVFCIQFFNNLHNFSKLDFFLSKALSQNLYPTHQSTTEEPTIQQVLMRLKKLLQ